MIPQDLNRVLVYLIQILVGPLSSLLSRLEETYSTYDVSAHPGRHVLSHCLSVCLSTRHPRVPLSHAPHLPVTPDTLVTSNSSNTTHFVLLSSPRGTTTGVRSRAHASPARACVQVACGRGYVKFRSIHRNAFATLVCHWRRRCARLKKTSNVRNKHDVRYNRNLLLASSDDFIVCSTLV